ncbi:phage NrS-1 polymerase family protein [Haladaptatus sp. DFWS20]|uniref:phage NrS-1 polymerase family protein n=1 Tax=Haladaptatus sp. DFWS20 TaxID=3403467 RepID=UPI003EC0A14B
MDRQIRRLGLHCEKWDAVHSGDGRTYGEITIERAVSVSSDFHSLHDDGVEGSTETDSCTDDNLATTMPMAESTKVVTTDDGAVSLHERERARIETITKLERTLRALESENERLRNGRDDERALEADDLSESTPGIFARLKRIFGHKSR